MRRRTALIAIPMTALTAFGVAGLAAADPPGTLRTLLEGSNEVPGPGDPDGIGLAKVLPQSTQSRVCVSIKYRDIGTPTLAHIHDAPSTASGPAVVDFGPLLATSPPGTIRGCVAADPALVADIATNPAEYYVNVHTAAFGSGAIRGQLA